MTKCITAVYTDDDPNFQLLGKMVLKHAFPNHELRIHTGTTGLDLINLVNEHSPDIVLTDHIMPKLEGVRAVKELRNQGYEGQVLVLSGTLPEAKRWGEGLDRVSFEEKPYDITSMINKVRSLWPNYA